MTALAPSQPLAALELANRVRSERARLKRRIAVNPVLVAGTILNPPEWVLSMPVQELLRAVPKFGPVKVTKIMRKAEVAPSVSVGGLTDRQRVVLLRDLKERV